MSEQVNRALIAFTGEHFAAFCLKMVGQPYWMGTCVYKCTNSLLTRKTEQYASHYGTSRTKQYKQDIAAKKVAADCIGGAKGYAWTNGGEGVLESIGTDKVIASKYQSNGCPDKGADSMFTYAKQQGMDWGAIGTLPEVPGVAVHKSGHVGYYVGNSEVVEWKGFAHGCVKTKLIDTKWTNWYKLPFIQYGEVATLPTQPDISNPGSGDGSTQESQTLQYRAGSTMLRGDDVLAVQTALATLGYATGTLDGIFGPKTDAAVRAFQRDNQLEVNGIVGSGVRAALQEVLEKAQDKRPEGSETDGDEKGDTEDAPVAPAITIRIQMTRSENIAVYGAGEVRIDIEEYLRGVVPSEMYESTNIEALKAQAICARTYACRRSDSLLSDTTKNQAFSVSKIGNCPRSDESIWATRGQVLTYDGKLVDCYYCASNKGMTKRSGDVWSTHYPYYVSKRDEWDEAARAERNITAFGHGIGMSQHGAMWAARKGVSCESILAFYYEGAIITDGSDKDGSAEEDVTSYTVQNGDTLWGMAASKLGSGARYSEVKALNGLTSDTIKAGQILKIPAK